MKKYIDKLIGDREHLPIEHRVLNIITLLGMVFAFINFILNIILGFSFLVILIPLVIVIVFFVLYYQSIKKKQYLGLVYTIIFFLLFVIYPMLWIFNGGSNGGIPIIFIFHSVMIALLLGKGKGNYNIFLIIQFITLIALFMIEYFYPDIIVAYDSVLVRLIDVGVTVILVSMLIFVLVLMIIKQYNLSLEQLKILHRELIEANEKLKIISITDELTGIYNRRFVMDVLKSEIKIKKERTSLSIIMIDIDNFKLINDKFGHGKGDQVIKKVAKLLSDNVRSSDTVGRIGGEEFLILLPDLNIEKTRLIAEKLRILIESQKWENKMKVTISGGVYNNNTDETINDILHKVDLCLYSAKNNGKNNIQSYADLKNK